MRGFVAVVVRAHSGTTYGFFTTAGAGVGFGAQSATPLYTQSTGEGHPGYLAAFTSHPLRLVPEQYIRCGKHHRRT